MKYLLKQIRRAKSPDDLKNVLLELPSSGLPGWARVYICDKINQKIEDNKLNPVYTSFFRKAR